MEVVIAVAAKIAEYTVVPIGQWVGFSFQYGGNIENLKNRVEELQGARERVQHAVTAALNSCEEIENDVQGWLTKVDKITEEAREVLEGTEDAKSKSCNGKCLNLKPQHQLSRKARKIVQEIYKNKLLEKGRFDRVSYYPTPKGIVATPHPDYQSFESRKPIAVELMEALKNANINVVGVYGMGGIGKTTLVTEVGRKAKEDKVFNEVVMVDVTPSPDIRLIQGEIVDLLHLKFDAETERGRATRLLERLTNNKKILVVLDNIWKPLDLEKIGIPGQGCKVVLISRNLDVLSEMKTEKDFGIEVLPKDEAWNLFATMVGDSINTPNIFDTATKVANKCAGLPVALVAVSKALKNKSLYEWKDALRRLERPAPKNLGKMESTIYSCIELSYSHLEGQEVKNFFLLCAMQRYYIPYMDVLKYWYGLGSFSSNTTLEETRNSIYTIVQRLKDLGLLQGCQMLHCPLKEEHFHRHDVVHYVAKLIASMNHYMVIVGDGDSQKEWPNVDVLKRCKAFCDYGGNIHELSNEMEFPELKLFCMSGRNSSLQIPKTWFQRMGKLKVLDFTSAHLLSLPSSLLHLINLQTLCLDHCVLKDIAIIGKLKNLAILSLFSSNISKLPQEIGLLSHLRLLDLRNCSKLEVIPPNVISNLIEMEELYMGGTSIKWEVEGLNNERNNASLVELKHLFHLIALEIHIQDASTLPKDLFLEKLERYQIFIGDVWEWFNKDSTSRTLKLKMNTSIQLEVGIRKMLRTTESLCIDELKGANSTLHELDWEYFQHLKHLQIQNNPQIKYIINSKILVNAFPTLETLILRNMINLEAICQGQLALTSFCNLRTIKVKHCDSLKFFISSSMVNSLSLLEELEIKECKNMVTIVMKEEGEIEDEHVTWFPKFRFLVLHRLPKLMGFLIIQNSFKVDVGKIILESKLDCYTQILQGEVVFPKLEKLELSSIHWEDVWHKKQWATSSCKFTSTPRTSRFQNLLSLIVRGSGNIKHLLSFSAAKSMVQLKCLEIQECNVMEEIIRQEDLVLEEEAVAKRFFSQIETLCLIDLPFLKWFCKGSNIKFSSLKRLEIKCCPKFMTFICKLDHLGKTDNKGFEDISANKSSYVVMEPLFNEMVAFPKLEELSISHIVDLKKIWHDQIVENSFCKVQDVKIKSCENLTAIFQSHMLARFQSLLSLEVSDCSSLQNVFELQRLNVEETVATTVIQLKYLNLADLPKMRHVWNKDPHLVFTFKDLQKVQVRGCDSLKSLFPASVARSLTQLTYLDIKSCGMEEIVAREESAQATPGVSFLGVTHLVLENLPSLEQFQPGEYIAEWPNLRKIWVERCSFVPTLLSFEEALQDSHYETSNKQLYFLVDKDQVKSIDSKEEFEEDWRSSEKH